MGRWAGTVAATLASVIASGVALAGSAQATTTTGEVFLASSSPALFPDALDWLLMLVAVGGTGMILRRRRAGIY
jgi:hypothetical protein